MVRQGRGEQGRGGLGVATFFFPANPAAQQPSIPQKVLSLAASSLTAIIARYLSGFASLFAAFPFTRTLVLVLVPSLFVVIVAEFAVFFIFYFPRNVFIKSDKGGVQVQVEVESCLRLSFLCEFFKTFALPARVAQMAFT